MRKMSENGTIFICDICDAVIQGGAAAATHYKNCTIDKNDKDSELETENWSILSPTEEDEKELLMAEVFCREPLWNSLLPYAQRNHNVTSTLWQEVDRVLGAQNGYSQKTFKSLRDRFVKLLAEESKSKRSGSAASSKVDWKYFTQLNFLRPSVEYRPTTSNLSTKKRSNIETSVASCSFTSNKKNKSVTPAGSFVTEDFELFCKKQLESVPDRIGSFMLYLESEMRVLSQRGSDKVYTKNNRGLDADTR